MERLLTSITLLPGDGSVTNCSLKNLFNFDQNYELSASLTGTMLKCIAAI